jgi:hypothetical protein
MGVALDFNGETVVGLEDDSRRWVSVKRFGWDGHGDDAAVLTSLTGHSAYRDADPDRPGSYALHGPYDADAITAAAFEPVGPDQVTALIDGFYQLRDHPTPPAERARVEAVVGPLGAAANYRLREQPDAVLVGGVFLDFQEVVGIDRAGQTVLLVVLATEL